MQCLQRRRGHCVLDLSALAGATADGNVSGVFKAAARIRVFGGTMIYKVICSKVASPAATADGNVASFSWLPPWVQGFGCGRLAAQRLHRKT